MSTLLRELLCLAVAFAVSWVIVFARMPLAPAPSLSPSALPPVALTPVVASYAHSEAPPEPVAAEPSVLPEPAPEPEPEQEPEPVPPPAELGTPEGERDVPRTAAAEDREEPAEPRDSASVPDEEPLGSAPSAEALMEDTALLASARDELAGGASRGFGTVLLASPEDQLEIARFFGETLVLVPRASLDPEATEPRYWRIAADGTPRVVAVAGRPPLERFRQYRDLFDYEYARLPALLRDLRRTVIARDEVYLYAALIPPREWALVIGRRDEALQRLGRDASEVRTFVLRYVSRPVGGFDLDVEEIVFADGTRNRPDSP